MFILWKRNRIIKNAVAKTVSSVSDRLPKIYQHFFYGSVDIRPQNLVIWYLFETDAELESARSSGFCDDLQELTTNNLISLGYPQEAFEPTDVDLPTRKITIHGGTEEYKQALLNSMTNKKAMISFTTKEDIDKTANGDYRLYFQ